MLRLVLAAALLMMAGPAPAFAQTPPAPAQTAPPDPATQTSQRLAAARDLLTASLIDSGAFAASLRAAFAELAPQMLDSIHSSDLYRQITPAHQSAVDAYLNGMPEMVVNDVNERIPAMVETGTPRTAAIFNEGEARAIAAFLRTPEGRSIFVKGAIAGAQNSSAEPTLTDAEQRASDAFDTTPAGIAFNAHALEFSAVIEDLLREGLESYTPRFRAKFAGDMCTLLENQCPPAFREAAQAR